MSEPKLVQWHGGPLDGIEYQQVNAERLLGIKFNHPFTSSSTEPPFPTHMAVYQYDDHYTYDVGLIARHLRTYTIDEWNVLDHDPLA